MIESVEFKNFKVLRDATLPLSQVTLIVGPNGSGKTTAIDGLRAAAHPHSAFSELQSAGHHAGSDEPSVRLRWSEQFENAITTVKLDPGYAIFHRQRDGHSPLAPQMEPKINAHLNALRRYCLDAPAIAQPVILHPRLELTEQGGNLGGVLDQLRDQDQERFD